jgi:hypothetical protein
MTGPAGWQGERRREVKKNKEPGEDGPAPYKDTASNWIRIGKWAETAPAQVGVHGNKRSLQTHHFSYRP